MKPTTTIRSASNPQRRGWTGRAALGLTLFMTFFLAFVPADVLAFGRNIDGLVGIKRVSVQFTLSDSKGMLDTQPFQELLENHLRNGGVTVVKSDLKDCLKSFKEFNESSPDHRRSGTCAMAERDWGILYLSISIGSTEKPGKAFYHLTGTFHQPVLVRRAGGECRVCLAQTWAGSYRSGYTKYQEFESMRLKDYLKVLAEQLTADIKQANGGPPAPRDAPASRAP